MKARTRHDNIAHERQQRLALLLFITNLGVALFTVPIAVHLDWNPEPSGFEQLLFAGLLSFSWINLFVAAGGLGWLVGLPRGFSPGPAPNTPPFDAAFLARYRMVFYYTGVLANLAALALLTEVTGGLAESPYVALLVAFILTAQQLSRFRSQAGLMFAAGLAVTTIMLLLQPVASDPPTPPPHELVVVAVLLALVGGGWLSFREKPYNHYVEKHVRVPSQAHIYRDGKDAWRFALYEEIHRQDPILLRAHDTADGEYPERLKEQFEQYISEMGRAAEWDELELIWPGKCTASFAVTLRKVQT